MIIALYNRFARGGRVRRVHDELRSELANQTPGFEWIETGTVEEGVKRAAEAGPEDTVVAMGGDGSVHTVVEGLARSDFRATLGIIPVGTGNDFAYAVAAPHNIQEAVASLVAGKTELFDVGYAVLDDEHTIPFANAIGVGFDAAASIRSRRRKFLPGVARYLVSVLETLATWKAPQARVTGEDLAWEAPLMFTTIGNAPRSGGGFLITPDADPQDGLLDVCAVRELGVVKSVSLIPKVMTGQHRNRPEALLVRGSRFEIELDRPTPVHADGEIVSTGTRKVEVSVRPSCLRVVVPGI